MRRWLGAALLVCLCASAYPGVSSYVSAAATSGKAESFTFQAEVNRLMDILINSLYSNKDIFLRELISNASDALDKIRLLALTAKESLGSNPDLEIRLSIDKEKNMLKIRDTGVGMTKKDLIGNLGTIAKSGTSAFLEQMQKGGDVSLIGQFGVGFYSVYLVADNVQVISKHNDDKQYIWESKADGSFTITQDKAGEDLGRGTQINIFFKEDAAAEYLDEAKLRELVSKYSEFIDFPIYLYASKEVDVPAGDEEEEEPAEADESADDDISDEISEEGEEGDEEEAAPKTVKETVWEWDLLNDNKAIWLRSPTDVDDAEYTKFYKALAKAEDQPLSHVHFKAEGDVEFKALLFIPEKAPYGFMDNYYSNKAGLKLYVRRVFISDEFENLMPRYLNFLKGIVDSDTLPLSVSRETLQAHDSLKTMKKKLVRKALEAIKKLADADSEDTADTETEKDDDTESPTPQTGKYATFWKEFGKSMKLGIIEDGSNKQRLSKLLRFQTTKSNGELTSFDEYVSRMKPKQKDIYFIAGESEAELSKSPFLEKLVAKGYEVILFTDPVDEYVAQHLSEYDDKKLQNASKENLKLGGKDDKEKKSDKKLKETFKGLVAWWKEVLGSAVATVKVSNRLATSPAIVVTSQYGWSANMERIMKAQALGGDSAEKGFMKGMKTLEVNPRHPLIEQLRVKYEKDKDAAATKALAQILYDTALLESGFAIEQPKDFNARVHNLLASSLGIKGELKVPVEPEEVEEEDEDIQSEPEDKQQSKRKGKAKDAVKEEL
ncbi:hypothetical protein WJX73_003622 [Symbiochloris irregularis]|uniref:Heat shock protein 90 n=1 Tax=Symbiochloris irregularis TaxID=706552 RepID=A0AAW1PFV8_9CHLO